MKKDEKWMRENRWGQWGPDDEVGVLNDVTPADIVKAAQLIRKGKVYDLETLRFKGMPVWPGHAGWDLLVYASASGRKNLYPTNFDPSYNWYAKGGWCDKDINKYEVGLNTEVIFGPLHVGTHIDAFSHLTVGADNHWYNGFNEAKDFSNFGPLKADASTIPPIILRGILLDIPGFKGRTNLDPGEPITREDIIGCAKWEGIKIEKADAVLISTGQNWPEMDKCPNAGVTLEAAQYLVEEKDVYVIGNDQSSFENFPNDEISSFPGHIHPVHHYLLIQQGVHIMEMVQLGELAADKVYEFCFIGLPSKIKCSTGMMFRPVAII